MSRTTSRLPKPPSSLFSLFSRRRHRRSPSPPSSSPSPAISSLARDLLSLPSPTPDISPLLHSHSFPSLLRSSPTPTPSLHLLSLLSPRPSLALEVFKWRRTAATGPDPIPLSSEEYTKAIAVAGRAGEVETAVALFYEAIASFPETALYNALMSAYMVNGMMRRCLAVFQSLKQDRRCKPTIVSYNILLSLFGGSLLVDHMEAVLVAADEAGMVRNLETYNSMIAAYITGFMWDRMEATYREMQTGLVKPELSTHFLMLRGYALSGNIEKMEDIYRTVSQQVGKVDTFLIRAMVCAYCKSSSPNRIQRIEQLLEHITGAEYRPWLQVLLIRAYAQEGMLEVMERAINEAFMRNTAVIARRIMLSIVTSYFRCGAVDQLADFVQKAEAAGWKLCRSLFHCKMVMYGTRNRLHEMHNVLDEMERLRFNRTKKTFIIMHKAYWNVGRRQEANAVVGLMWKYGVANVNDCLDLPLEQDNLSAAA